MNSPTSQAHSTCGKELPPGTRLEEFVIERVIGSGGFGITYLARDTSLNRQVVIKENLPSQFAHRDTTSLTVHAGPGREDQENFRWSLENFSREGETLASLHHPGIVPVLRRFEAFGTAYFVMPYIEGTTLDVLLLERQEADQPFSETELRGLLERVLDALAYLHERGIYHRDIKPGNILITSDGMPVLIDFGSARQRLSERSMTVVESAGYTPFEQLQSRGNVGRWSDLYSLGATLVKVMTGEAPPKAMDRIRNDPYLPLVTRAELVKLCNPGFLASIDKAFAVEEGDRWKDASEWQGGLSQGMQPKVQAPGTALPEAKLEVASESRGLAKKGIARGILAMAACVLFAALLWRFGADFWKSRSPQVEVLDHVGIERERAESISKQERDRKAADEARAVEAARLDEKAQVAEEVRISEERASAEQERLAALAEEMARPMRETESEELHPGHRVIPRTFFDMLCKVRENAELEAEKYYAGSTAEMKEGNSLIIDRLTKALIQLVAAVYDDSQIKGLTPKEFVDAKLKNVFELLEMQMDDEIRDGGNGTLGTVEVGLSKIEAVAEIIEGIVKANLSPEVFTEWSRKWDAAGEAAEGGEEEENVAEQVVVPKSNGLNVGGDPLVFLVERRVNRGEVAGWDEDRLSFALNYLYARQGYPFLNQGNEGIRKVFMGYSWYRPVEGMTDDQASGRMSVLVRGNMELLAAIRAKLRVRDARIEDSRASLTTDLLSLDQAIQLSMGEIRYALNYLYARHGFPFEGEKFAPIRQEFTRYRWYRPVPGRTMEEIDRMMNAVERQNVENLAEARKRK